MECGKVVIDKKNARPWKNALFPLSFVFSALLNLLFFYLGFAYEDNAVRTYGFILGCVLFAVLCGLTLLSTLRGNRLSVRSWVLLGAVLLYFVASFVVSYVKFGLNSVLLQYIQQFIVFVLPAFFMGIYGAVNEGEQKFFNTLECLSFLAFPGALIYADSVVFDCLPWNHGSNLGILNYMSLAYTFMPFLLAHIICFAEKEEWKVPLTEKKVKHPQRLRGVFIAVYWIAIIASVTRGAYVCVIGFCVLLVISKLIHRERVKPVLLISLAMVALLLFNLFVYAPPGLYRLSRVNIFFDGLKQGELVTTDAEDENVAEQLEELIQADGGKQITNRPGTEPIEPTEPTDIASENLQIGNRGTLFKLAIGEFLKAPLFGMGACGYSIKYGNYPHNVILEMLCETGILGTGLLILLVVYAFVQVLAVGRKRKELRYLLLFFVAYAIQANISGSIWKCSVLLCALGYGLSLPERTKMRYKGFLNAKKIKSAIMEFSHKRSLCLKYLQSTKMWAAFFAIGAVVVIGTTILSKCVSSQAISPETNNSTLELSYYHRTELPEDNPETFDKNGVRMHIYTGGVKQYNPLFIANAAEGYYLDFTSIPDGYRVDPRYEQAFWTQISWLENNANYIEKDGFILYPYRFDWGDEKNPWFSAMTQCRIAKVFLLAYELTGDQHYFNLAEKSAYAALVSIEEGGFTYTDSRFRIYEEYRNPFCNHSLNGHLSVVLDLLEINETLQNRTLSEELKIDVKLAKELIPLYEDLSEMAWALAMPKEDISAVTPEELINNTYYSYDLIHLKYIHDLYTHTSDLAYQELLFRYYASMCLRGLWETGKNVLSTSNGASVVESSGFSSQELHTLEDAFDNYMLYPEIYAAGVQGAEEQYFIVELGKPQELGRLEVRFHWAEYPRSFQLYGLDGDEWVLLHDGNSYVENQIYDVPIDYDGEVSAVKFVASDFTGQQRLLLDYLNVEVADQEKVAIWERVDQDPLLGAMGLYKTFVNKYGNPAKMDILEMNDRMVTVFSDYLLKYDCKPEELFKYVKAVLEQENYKNPNNIIAAYLQSLVN